MNTDTEKPRSKSPLKITVTNDEATNQLIRDLVKKRAIVKSRLTRFSTYINSLPKDISTQARADLKLRMQGATSLFAEFNNLQTQLEEAVVECDLNEQLRQRDVFEDSYYSTLAQAECMLSSEVASCSNVGNTDSIRLPTISVPTFDGSSERWLEFRDTFLSLIHNSTQISNIQKFHYLKSSLKGCAALVIDSLEFSSDNYLVAWELILNRYNNSKLLVHSHVKALFTIQPLTKESPDMLRNLIDTILKNLRALKLLGEPVDTWDTLIIYIIVTKLDKTTEREWEQYKNTIYKQSVDSKSSVKVDVLLSFLKDRADMLQTLIVSHSADKNLESRKSNNNSHNNYRVHCNLATNNKPSRTHTKRLCLLCNCNHSLYACQVFLKKSLDERLTVIKNNNLCENCLRPGHVVRDCRMGPCRKCEMKHNSLIHNDVIHSARTQSHTACENATTAVVAAHAPLPTAPDGPSYPARANVLCSQYPCVQPILLSTALIDVLDYRGTYHEAVALLDSGSERCIITRSLCELLKIPSIQSTQEIRGVGNAITQSTQVCEVSIKSRVTSYTTTLQCFVLPHITTTIMHYNIPKRKAQFKIPDNIQLANPLFDESQKVDLLIGADKFWDLLKDGKIRLPNGPCMQNTYLGWLISGPIYSNTRNKDFFQCNFTQTIIDNQLRKFWELEEVPKLCDSRSDEERECENHFSTHTVRDKDGRFCVAVPLKSSPHNLGETFSLALKRFLALEKRLLRCPDYKALYVDFIDTFIKFHIFTDASQTAYGACIYVRTVTDIEIMVRLLCSKGKVAPLKPVTIPRLELCGALLGARLYDKVRSSLRCNINGVVFWTDSTIVLGWLRMPTNLLKTVVQNRISEIHELTDELPWRHVSGKENPADLASRGVPLSEFVTSSLWWEGPSMLKDPNLHYNRDMSELKFNCNSNELPEVKCNQFNVLLSEPHNSIFPFTRFSQFNRMVCTFAYVLRFINNARKIKCDRQLNELTVDELKEAELSLAKLSQLETFRNELDLLSKGTTIKQPSLSKLNLFLDTNKIIRVGGRLGNSDLFKYDKMHPVLLASKHHFSLLLFRERHTRLLHAGAQTLLYILRQCWWPLGGRNLARKVVNECILCRRLKGKTLSPLMGNLPKERLTPTYPFLTCGVDYAGPILTLNRKGRGARTVKSYICLFICFITRAVHIELVSDLSSEAYILALKRFIARRGKPAEIFSDNGKNFVGAMNEFSKSLQSFSPDILEYAHNQSIKFKFIPVYSPHFGGLWESGVRLCKHHLLRVIGNAHLTFEETTTVLVQIEAILNSRPLSPLSSDPTDLLPLSPAHFLVGRPLTAPVSPVLQDRSTSLLTRFQRIEQLRQHFWSRWSKEYISELQTRCKWRTNADTLLPNTLVVIKDDYLPPLKWQLGRIEKIYPGRDGISRVADIRTSSGTVRRAFTKICPLLGEHEMTLLEDGASKAGGMSRNGTTSNQT